MLEQLTQLVQEFGQDAVVKNEAIPNEQNEAVLKETSSSIISSLQKIATDVDLTQIVGLLHEKDIDKNHPTIQKIITEVSNSLTEKLGIEQNTATNTTTNLIPKVLHSLISKARDPNDKSITLSEILESLTGGNSPEHASIMDAIDTYGIHFGLDQNSDGQIDLEDAKELTKKGGLGAMLGKLFGK
ncbi:hypothetical protein ACYE2N_02420 [Flavobacterium sp. MAHUQ-51]|uniref:hypothetical protein n=1 Tax=Flavobacterium sp. GCM10022190 TaxID=3252639 RepID=UPI003617E803